jgi:hypothetical protein
MPRSGLGENIEQYPYFQMIYKTGSTQNRNMNFSISLITGRIE